jgi:transcriptional regulator with XRE-family HTH domain
MGKPLDHQMGAYLQSRIRQWLADNPDRSEADFSRESGLSRTTINNVKNKGVGVGNATLAGFAKVFGTTIAELHQDAEAWANGGQVRPALGPRIGELPAWAPLAERLRKTPRGRRFSDEAWAAAASTASHIAPRTFDEYLLVQLLDFWQQALAPVAEDKDPPSEERPSSPLPTARAS